MERFLRYRYALVTICISFQFFVLSILVRCAIAFFLLFGIVSSALPANSLGVLIIVLETTAIRRKEMASVGKGRGDVVETVENRPNVEERDGNAENKAQIGEKSEIRGKEANK